MQANDGNGTYAYSRIWGSREHWVFVAFNTWRERLEAGGGLGVLNTSWDAGQVIVNVLRPEERYTLGPGGRLASLWLDPYETKVFVPEGSLRALDPVVHRGRLTPRCSGRGRNRIGGPAFQRGYARRLGEAGLPLRRPAGTGPTWVGARARGGLSIP